MTYRIDRITLTLDVCWPFDRHDVTIVVDQPPADAPLVAACVQAWADDYARLLREAQEHPPQSVEDMML